MYTAIPYKHYKHVFDEYYNGPEMQVNVNTIKFINEHSSVLCNIPKRLILKRVHFKIIKTQRSKTVASEKPQAKLTNEFQGEYQL